MTLALVDPSNVVIREAPDGSVDLTAGVKTGYRWLPLITITNDTRTPGNTFTVQDQPVLTVLANRVERTVTLRDMTAQEADARKTALVDSDINLVQFKHLFDLENRVRSIEGRPQITVNQYRTALKGML